MTTHSRQMRRDRRFGRRLAFADDALPEARLAIHEETVLAHVHDISEEGLRVSFVPPHATLNQGDVVHLVMIGVSPEIRIDKLQVKRFHVTRGDHVMAVLVTDSDATRATLWQLLEQLSHGRGMGPLKSTVRLEEPLPKIPGRGIYTEEARLARLEWLRIHSGTLLAPMQRTGLDPEKLSSNIENMIGSVEIPVGIAGPLLFRGQDVRDVIFAPMATTEGALVASCARGATALSRSGGVITRVISQRMMRVPLFIITSLSGAITFAAWIRDHVVAIREQTRQVSRHARLISLEPSILGTMVHVSFLYETGDAAGQNMTTSCTWHACQWIVAQMKYFKDFEIENFYIEANVSGDKKVTFLSFIAGRGIRVVAEAEIPASVVQDVLKCTPEELVKTHMGMLAGSVHVGMVGYNINVANVIGALFAATGQDIACVHECSLAQLYIEATSEGVYASMLLPSLIVGTVGGGTHLPTQRSMLEMLGCAGGGKVRRFAEIIAGFCLALDISTLAANASGQFATAHERLGRNRPVSFFEKRELTTEFFEKSFRESLRDPSVRVTSVAIADIATGSSIVTELTGRATSKLVGLFPMQIGYDTDRSPSAIADVIVKVKPLDDEVIVMVNRLASMCSPLVAATHEKHRARTGFRGCHIRELAIYAEQDPRFLAHTPRVYGIHRDDSREAYVLVLEHLKGATLLDSADSPNKWREEHVLAVLRGASALHSIWYGKEAELFAAPWIGAPHTSDSMTELRDLWSAIALHSAAEFPDLVRADRLERLRAMIRSIPEWWPRLESMPRTLCHNDFNPRNLCLRQEGGGFRLCAYDWELATVQVPQHDVAEFLAFVLPSNVNLDELERWVDVARRELERATRTTIDATEWREGFALSLRDLAVNRFLLYLMAHTFRQYNFLEHATETLWRMLDLTRGWA